MNLLEDEELSGEGGYRGTNDLLDHLGFAEGKPRNDFLRGFTGDAYDGVDIVRAAFKLVKPYGLVYNYQKTHQQRKDIFSSISHLIHNHGTPFTGYLVDGLGLERIPELMDYSLLQIGKNMSLVPTSDLENMVLDKGIVAFLLRSRIGPFLMTHLLNYKAIEFEGTPFMYQK